MGDRNEYGYQVCSAASGARYASSGRSNSCASPRISSVEAPRRKISWGSRRSLTCPNWRILLRKLPNTPGTHIRSCRPFNRISRGWTRPSTWWRKHFNARSLRESNGPRSLSLDFLKAHVWRRNSLREMRRVTVVSWHSRADLLVRPELGSFIPASFQALPVSSVRVIAIPTFHGSEWKRRHPCSRV